MPGNVYEQLHKQLQDLIVSGANIADSIAGTSANDIHDWIQRARSCLAPLGERMPTALSDFDSFWRNLEFRVEAGSESAASKSSYWSDEAEDLMDFRFENLRQMNGILKRVAAMVVGLVNATDGSLKGEFFDVRVLKATRAALRVTQHEAAMWFRVNVRTYRRWEGGQSVMRLEANRRLGIFLEHAKQGQLGLPPDNALNMPS